MTPIEAELLFARALVLIGLYGFLGLVGLAAWRDLRVAASGRQRERDDVAARLIVLDGGASDRAPGTQFPLRAVTNIGRDLDNDIVLADATISGRHALLTRRDGAWWIEDLGSRNGVAVNRAAIGAAVPFVVRSGDAIALGAVRLRLVCPDDGA